jgi:hypothetical protein
MQIARYAAGAIFSASCTCGPFPLEEERRIVLAIAVNGKTSADHGLSHGGGKFVALYSEFSHDPLSPLAYLSHCCGVTDRAQQLASRAGDFSSY